MLREKAAVGQLIAFNWATAKFGDKEFRMNGQHSSAVLSELNGQFPEGLKVHLDSYEVDTKEGLALLFRQFDSRKIRTNAHRRGRCLSGPLRRAEGRASQRGQARRGRREL